MNDTGLTIDHITVRFGGNLAVNDVSLSAPLGRITGLIGPNGAGKTTTFNVCSGLLSPAPGGQVHLLGHDVTHQGPSGRARRGLGRTFQRMELFGSMTVAENVALGREAGVAGASPWRQLISHRSQRHVITEAVDRALTECGLTALAGARVGALSTGQRRLVELARARAAGFRVVLLDEPSSGLDPHETGDFGLILRRWVEDEGIGILLVEHDMSLVMSVCQHIHVLDFGTHIFEGSPSEVQASPIVQAAYLGDEQGLAMAESGVTS